MTKNVYLCGDFFVLRIKILLLKKVNYVLNSGFFDFLLTFVHFVQVSTIFSNFPKFQVSLSVFSLN